MTTRLDELMVVAHHVVSPVGLSATQACAAIRAGIARFRAHPDYCAAPEDPGGPTDEAAIGGFMPPEELDSDGEERLVDLACRSLRGLLERGPIDRSDLATSGLLLALPAAEPATGGWNLDGLPELVLERTGLEAMSLVGVDRGGHTAVLGLVARAFDLLEQGEVERCVVLGVDSYFPVERLKTLDQTRRLRSERGIDGFRPGEAAAGLIVERAGGPAGDPGRCLARLGRPGFGLEPQPFHDDRSSSGAGLMTAVGDALKGSPDGRPITFVLCDLNGESYRAFEWGVVQVRLADRLGDRMRLVHPAEAIGDVGAASGALLIACAVESFRRRYAGGDRALVWTASDDDRRAAMLVFSPGGHD